MTFSSWYSPCQTNTALILDSCKPDLDFHVKIANFWPCNFGCTTLD